MRGHAKRFLPAQADSVRHGVIVKDVNITGKEEGDENSYKQMLRRLRPF